MKNVENFIVAELLRCTVDRINHIQSRLLQEYVGCLRPAKTKNVETFIFAKLLRCTVDFINHIHMYFVNTNAVEAISRVGGVSPPSKNEKG